MISKRSIMAFLIVAVLIMSTACSTDAKKQQETQQSNNQVINITFWHAMGGVGGEAINKMVENFNKTHPNIKVTAQYQGSYDDEINKLRSAMQGKAGPDVVQIYDIGTRFMIDSGWITPVQNFVDSEKFDTSQLEPNLLAYYTVDNKLYSMPFNSSTPLLYYNKTAFKEAGLDPEKPPRNFKEIEEYSKVLLKKDSSGNVTQYGYSMAIYGWFFEQLLAKEGALYANNENGREGRATAVEFDKNEAGINILTTWKNIVDSGLAINLGRKTADTQNAFAAGRIAMTIDSTAVLGSILKNVGDRFEVGTGSLPSISDNPPANGGVIIGGASLWIIDNGSKEKQNAAWEFVKFMISPEQQVFWNKQTGYFPVTKKAYDLPEMQEHLKQRPQFKTAIDQLHSTPITTATKGALIGVFPEARQTIEANIEKMLQGQLSPKEAIMNAAKDINSAIETYNKTYGQ